MFGAWLPPNEDGLEQRTPDPSSGAFVTSSGTTTWAKFQAQVEDAKENFAKFGKQRVGLLLDATPESMARLFALVEVASHPFLMAADTPNQAVAAWSEDFGLSATISASGSIEQPQLPAKEAADKALTILTSGTTGKPKAVEHTLQSLARPVRRTARGGTWLLTFRPHLYAGLQVAMQCLLNFGTLVMTQPRTDAVEIARICKQAGVEFLSATPSFWRWFLAMGGDELAAIPLKQATLGGEAVDQATLDGISSTFPLARVAHIYATTELGRCFSVVDGLAGFPAALLDSETADGVQIRIEDGELVVRSANAMRAYDVAPGAEMASHGAEANSPQSDWFATGDLVAQEGNRVVFVGRKTDMINVGGNKVYPLEVETLIRSVPGVADTRVFGEASSLVGELVKCEIVIDAGFEPNEVEKAVRTKALAELANFQRPRFISIVDEIPRTDAGKTKRQ